MRIGGIVLALAFAASPAFAYEANTPRQNQRFQTASTNWVGFAVSRNGRVFYSNPGTESWARNSARTECEQTSLHSCNAIAVSATSDVIAIHCRDGSGQGGFIGGSNINYGAAEWIAFNKAQQAGYGDRSCRIVYVY